MKFIVPWVPKVTDQYRDDPMVLFYQAINIPALQGGRQPHEVANTVMNFEQIRGMVDLLGDRFRVLANSCFPEWNDNVHNLMEYLDRKGGHIVVTRMEFAKEIKKQYRGVRIHSSVIMNFYHPMKVILASPLFDTVGGSQFNNDDTARMIEEVPVGHRARVLYLLLGCVWSNACLRHYELPTLQYKYPRVIKEQFHWSECTGKRGFDVKFEQLLDAGFELFKFGDRTPTLEQVVEKGNEYLSRYEKWKSNRVLTGGQTCVKA